MAATAAVPRVEVHVVDRKVVRVMAMPAAVANRARMVGAPTSAAPHRPLSPTRIAAATAVLPTRRHALTGVVLRAAVHPAPPAPSHKVIGALKRRA